MYALVQTGGEVDCTRKTWVLRTFSPSWMLHSPVCVCVCARAYICIHTCICECTCAFAVSPTCAIQLDVDLVVETPDGIAYMSTHGGPGVCFLSLRERHVSSQFDDFSQRIHPSFTNVLRTCLHTHTHTHTLHTYLYLYTHTSHTYHR